MFYKIFSYCVSGNIQVIRVTSKGFISKKKVVFWKAIRGIGERIEEWDRWIGWMLQWLVVAGTL